MCSQCHSLHYGAPWRNDQAIAATTLAPMAHEHPYPLAAGTAHASLRRRCASGESIYHMAPIPSLTRSLCSGSLAAREPLPLSRAKWFSGKGVALTSELIPPYPACFVIVEWTLHAAVYSLMYVYTHTTWLPMPWSHVYIHVTSSSLFPMPYHSGATPEFSIQIQIHLQLAGTIRKAGTIRELLVASKWQGKARQLHYGAPIVHIFNLKFDTAYLFVFILRYFHLVSTCQSHSQARRSRLNLELSFKFIPYHSRECNFQCLRSTIEIPLERISIPDRRKLLIFFLSTSFFKKTFYFDSTGWWPGPQRGAAKV